jgi:hypothetical protein
VVRERAPDYEALARELLDDENDSAAAAPAPPPAPPADGGQP